MDLPEMTEAQLAAIKARLDEPPPVIALAERNRGTTALNEYLKSLSDDRIALAQEVARLREELRGRESTL